MGVILFIIASVLKWFFTPIGYIYGFIRSITLKELSEWHRDLALSKDRYGNVLLKHLNNDISISKEGYKFGNGKETMRSVYGKNKLKKTLLMLGRLVAKILNDIEKDHVEKAIDDKV